MKIKEGFKLRTLCGEHIVVGEGINVVDFNKMLTLNDSAAWLWEQVQGRDFTSADLVALLMEKYEVEEQRAAEDVDKLLQTWQQEGIVI